MKFPKNFFYLLAFIFSLTVLKADLGLEDLVDADLFDVSPDIAGLDVTEPVAVTRGTPLQTLSILAGAVDARTILQTNIYRRTNPITRKDVVDYPIFQHIGFFEDDGLPATRWDFIPFFSQTFNEIYYKNFDELKDYIDLDQEHLLRRLDRLHFTDINIPGVLSLFGKMKLQEHRIGVMFDWSRTKEKSILSIRIPLYYDEHNFYLNSTQRQQIIDQLGDADPEFVFDHLVADFLAIGDTKLTFEYLVKKSHRYELTLGLRATLPTKIRIGKGLAGAYFDVDKQPTSLDIHTDVFKPMLNPIVPTDAEQQAAQDRFVNFGLDVLDHLSTLLLEQGNRNNFHVGIGPQMHSTMRFNSDCYMTTLLSLELLTPWQEVRFFKVKNDETAFNAFTWQDDDGDADLTQPEEKIAFLNEQLKEKFFPPGYQTTVWPGVLLQSTTGVVIKRHRVTWTLGSDFWLNSKESFGTIYAPSKIKPLLDTEAAKMGTRWQSTMWIALDRNYQPGYKWQYGGRFSIGGLSSGIGPSTSLALYLERMF